MESTGGRRENSTLKARANLSEGNQTLVIALTARPIRSARSSVSGTEAS